MKAKIIRRFSVAIITTVFAAPYAMPAQAQLIPRKTLCQAVADTECKNSGYISYGYSSYAECYEKLVTQCDNESGGKRDGPFDG